MAANYTRRITLYINDKEVENNIASIQKAYFKANNELKKMELGSKEYIAQISKVKELKGIIDEHALALKNVQKSGFSFSKLSDGFNKYFGIITAGAASMAGLILGARKAIDTFNEFQAKVSELSALTGLAGEDLNWLSDQAKELSISTLEGGIKITKSATDILEAYKLMGSAKPELLKDKEALNEVTKQALILAEASKMETGPAVEALANIMNQFGAPASEAGKFINILAAGSKEGAAEVNDLGDAIVRSGAAAMGANISIEQEVGLVEVLAEKGVKAERAGTGLRGTILKMQKGADEFNPKVVGMSKALENLAAKNLSTKEMMELFGEESYTVASLLINNRKRFDELTAAVTGTNVAYEQAAINTDNNAAKLAQAQNKATLMRIELGEKLAPAMTHVVSTGSLVLKMLSALVDLFSKHGSEILLVAGAIAAYTIAVRIQTAETKANALWTKIAAGTQAAWGTITGILTGKIKIATIAQKAWNLMMAMNPIGAIIAGVALLAAGVIFLVKTMNAQTVAQKAVNDVNDQAKRDIIEQKNKTEDLLAVAKSEKVSLEQRKAALAELNKISPEYFGNLSIEKSTTEQLTAAGKAYIDNLEKQALVKAAQTKIDDLRAENGNKEVDIEMKKTKWWETEAGAAKRRTKAINENKEAIKALQGIVDKNIDKSTTVTNNIVTDETTTATGGGLSDDAKKKARDKAFAYLETAQRKELNLIKQTQLEKNQSEEEYNKILADQELKSLTNKLSLEKKYGEDSTATTSSILDIKLKQQEEFDKKTEEDKKKAQKKEFDNIDNQLKNEQALIKKNALQQGLSEEETNALLLQKEAEYLQNKLALQKQYGEDTTETLTAIVNNINAVAENSAKGDEDRLKRLAELRKEFADEDVVKQQEKAAALAELDALQKAGLITSEEEYQKLKSKITEKYESDRFAKVKAYLEATQNILGGVSDFFGAMKDAELAKAGDNAAKKEAIEKKYAQKQQAIAIGQAIISGAQAVLEIWTTKSILPSPFAEIYKGVMTGLVIGTTAAQIAKIKSQKFKSGSFTPKSASDDTEVGVVHANEWVASAPLLRNPETRRHIDYLENVQRGLTPRFDTTAISGAVRGFQSGGFGSSTVAPVAGASTVTVVQQESPALIAVMQQNAELLANLKNNGVKTNINTREIFKSEEGYQNSVKSSEY